MEALNITETQKRYYFLDAVRGICVLGMVVYHTLFDCSAFFNISVFQPLIGFANAVHNFGAAVFICLSGICIHFGRRPLKRSIMLSFAGVMISAVTYVFVPDMRVLFGILTFMGLSCFIMLPLKRPLNRLPALPAAALSLCLFLMFFNAPYGYSGLYGAVLFRFPKWFYKNYFTALFGFPFDGFFSGDYFSLFPWIFMFFFGFFLWNCVKTSARAKELLNFRIRFFEKIGNLSFYIYILHQPVILFLLYLSNWILRSEG